MLVLASSHCPHGQWSSGRCRACPVGQVWITGTGLHRRHRHTTMLIRQHLVGNPPRMPAHHLRPRPHQHRTLPAGTATASPDTTTGTTAASPDTTAASPDTADDTVDTDAAADACFGVCIRRTYLFQPI